MVGLLISLVNGKKICVLEVPVSENCTFFTDYSIQSFHIDDRFCEKFQPFHT